MLREPQHDTVDIVQLFAKFGLEKEVHSPDSSGYPTARDGKSLGARSNSG